MGTEKRYIHGMFCRFHMKPTHVFILKRIKKNIEFQHLKLLSKKENLSFRQKFSGQIYFLVRQDK